MRMICDLVTYQDSELEGGSWTMFQYNINVHMVVVVMYMTCLTIFSDWFPGVMCDSALMRT